MKKISLIIGVIALMTLISCGMKNTALEKHGNLLNYHSGANDDYSFVSIDERVYIPFSTIDNSDRSEWIGIVDGDENNRIYEYKDYDSDDWIISFYNSGEMDSSMLMREQHVTDYPEGIVSEYDWNNLTQEECCNSEYPMLVKVNGVVYKSTGYASSAIGCGTMDGMITSTVDISEVPAENDQSNFGTDISYQYSSEGQLIVVIDGVNTIFRDINSSNTEIPDEVANFTAKIKGVRDDGSLLVTFVAMPEMFVKLADGDYVVDSSSIDGDFCEGDIVRIWFDGSVEEVLPAILPGVYKIEII